MNKDGEEGLALIKPENFLMIFVQSMSLYLKYLGQNKTCANYMHIQGGG